MDLADLKLSTTHHYYTSASIMKREVCDSFPQESLYHSRNKLYNAARSHHPFETRRLLKKKKSASTQSRGYQQEPEYDSHVAWRAQQSKHHDERAISVRAAVTMQQVQRLVTA